MRALAAGAELREPERAKSYLFRIVRNLVTDQARARARVSVEPWAAVPDVASVDLEPEAVVLRADAQALPRAAFAELPRGHQEILRLRFVEELDYDAVATRLHTTEHAARQRVYPRDAGAPRDREAPAIASRRELAGEQCPRAHLHRGVAEAGQCPGLDLAHPLPAQVHQLPDLVGVRGSPRSSPKRSVRM